MGKGDERRDLHKIDFECLFDPSLNLLKGMMIPISKLYKKEELNLFDKSGDCPSVQT